MKVTTSKSKNSESFYITQSHINSDGKSTSKRIRKLGTLKELTETLGTDRDGVMAWAKDQARLETEKYGKSKEPSGVFRLPGKPEQTAVPEATGKTFLRKFGHSKFIYCCDAGLGSEGNREFNHMGERAFIVTQSIRKLPEIEEEKDNLFYKDCPYTTKKLQQRLIITYSPKNAAC